MQYLVYRRPTQSRSIMGTHRDDITRMDRARTAIEVLYPYRPHGLASELAWTYHILHQTAYQIVSTGKELLDTKLSLAWGNAELSKREWIAATVNMSWQPTMTETLSGDEIYSNGNPNLLLVANDSLFIYTLARQMTCDGET